MCTKPNIRLAQYTAWPPLSPITNYIGHKWTHPSTKNARHTKICLPNAHPIAKRSRHSRRQRHCQIAANVPFSHCNIPGLRACTCTSMPTTTQTRMEQFPHTRRAYSFEFRTPWPKHRSIVMSETTLPYCPSRCEHNLHHNPSMPMAYTPMGEPSCFQPGHKPMPMVSPRASELTPCQIPVGG